MTCHEDKGSRAVRAAWHLDMRDGRNIRGVIIYD
jgi:hypothetical protein